MGDVFKLTEVNTGGAVSAWFRLRPGVYDHGMQDTTTTRQPGRPYVRFHGWERVPTTVIGEAELIAHRESDCLIVPMRAGNAAGGKEMTHGCAM